MTNLCDLETAGGKGLRRRYAAAPRHDVAKTARLCYGLLYLKEAPIVVGPPMDYIYPTPKQLGIKIPPTLREERFNAGFKHCLEGGRLDDLECFRLSFRMGYRTGKLYLKDLRRRQGIIDFPMRARFKLRVDW